MIKYIYIYVLTSSTDILIVCIYTYMRWVVSTIFQFRGLRFCVYPKDHNPKHVHVIGNEFEVKIRLDTFAIIKIKGSLNSKNIKIIINEIQNRIEDLERAWDELTK